MRMLNSDKRAKTTTIANKNSIRDYDGKETDYSSTKSGES